MKFLKYFLWVVIALLLSGIIYLASMSYFSGSHTRYCPLSHRLDDLSRCFVLDRLGDRTLVQHGSLNAGDFYLEVIDDGVSKTFQFPDSINAVGENAYSAKLVDGEEGFVLINGNKFMLKKYQARQFDHGDH
ncbi:hypothetical protein EDC56_1095 [Sinobacterium caligoides]|uniref:Uncharacterized protein n=1 Tax=Sinobacterium caligoides TaxID=933926 RepID=A0A3N2E1M0_9GAMM|nr:hypothetical protein [Sinobacterium caligoides]ROS05559.1 hypothetical protein EDC56_1095 [Sinobacterium caligoides]